MTGTVQKQTVPLVSVVMAAYNAQAVIEKAIRSVLEQTMIDWELIVVDDCSDDSTAAVVGAIAQTEPRITLYVNEQNAGAAEARNKAMALAKGKYVAFLDADDRWYPHKLEKQIQKMEQTQADLVYTSYKLVQLSGAESYDYLVPEETSFDAMLSQNCIGCSTVLLKREWVQQNRFTTEYFHEDYVLWLDLLRKGAKMVGLLEILMDYTVCPASKAGNKVASAKQRWIIYRKHLCLPLLKSVGYFMQYALAGVKKYRTVSK